jgi:hypothetical protein
MTVESMPRWGKATLGRTGETDVTLLEILEKLSIDGFLGLVTKSDNGIARCS